MSITGVELNPTIGAALQQLLLAPQQFDFFQAVRLVNQLVKQKSKFADKYSIYFKATPSLSFPAHLIDQVKLLQQVKQPDAWQFEIQVSFLGLFGASGLLPNHYTELLMQRLQLKDTVLLDFLDLFNHRMVSLFYRAWQKNQFYVGYEQAKQEGHDKDCFSHMLHALTGNIINKTPGNAVIPEEALLFYAGYFADQQRSVWSLQSMLSDYFSVPVTVKQFQSKCLFLTAKNRTRLGINPDHYNQLGLNAVLGAHAWDSQHHFRVQLGPLTSSQFKEFLPGGKKLRQLIALTMRYMGKGITFDVCLVLKAQHVPGCQLGGGREVALGQNTWLKSRPFIQDASDTILEAFDIHKGKNHG